VSVQIKDLGFANSWQTTPPELEAHYKALEAGEHHDVSGAQSGQCVTTTTCKTCGIRWSIDSGD
jgi:hypothetical protein